MANINQWIRQQDLLKDDKGLGDTVKRITSAVGIKPCGGCQRRAEMLNKLIQYKRENGGK